MRESSFSFCKQNSQEPNYQGGEKKVMKKGLSLILAIAMVFSMFASVAFAAETAKTPAEAGALLKDLKVIVGNANGDLMADATWKRQDVAILLSRLLGVEAEAKATAKSHTFADVKNSFYDGVISWAKEKGYMVGKGTDKFGFGDEIKNQEFAAVVLRALGLDTSDYAKVGELAVKAGIVAEGTDMAAPAKRGGTYVVLVKALDFEVTPGVSLGASLKLPGYEAKKLAVVKGADAAGVKKIKVVFEKAVDTDKAVFAVKKGTSVVSVTKKTWNDAKTEAALETSITLSTGDYSVAVSGIEVAEGKGTATFTVVPERVETVALADNAFRESATSTTAHVELKLKNQYGEDFTGSYANTEISATSNTLGVTAAVDFAANKRITLSSVALDKAAVSLTVVELKAAKSVTKEVKVQNAKMVAEVTLSAPEIPSGKTVLEKGMTNVILPYKAVDQYSNEMDLTATTGLTFVSSDTAVVDPASVNVNDKKLRFNIKTFDGPKTVSLTVIVNATGKSSKVEFNVNGNAKPADVTLVAPTARIGANETGVKVELQVKDQFGNAMSAADIKAAADATPSAFTIVSGNASTFVLNATAVQVADGKAYVVIDANATGAANLTATVNATGKSSTTPITVVDAKYAAVMTLKPEFTKAVKGATIKVKATFLDQYGDEFKTDGTVLVSFSTENNNTDFGAVPADQTITALVNDGVVFTAGEHDKTTKVIAKLYKTNTTGTLSNLLDEKSVTLVSAKSDEALTYQVEALGTLADAANGVTTSPYAKEVKVFATDASGTKVALTSTAIQALTPADSKLVATFATKKVAAANADADVDAVLNVTVGKQDGTPIVLQAPVKVSVAAPAAASIGFKKGDDTVTSIKIARTGATVNFFNAAAAAYVEVKDQYGTTAMSSTASIYVTQPNGTLTLDADGSVVFAAGDAGDKYKITAVIGDKVAVLAVELQ